MEASPLQIEVEASDSVDTRWCFEGYFHDLATRFDAGFDPAKSISATPEELTPPNGAVVIARRDGRAVGCGALKATEYGIGEIKRMWVAEEARGLGIGKRILAKLEELAPGFGVTVLRLETNHTLVEAQSMYRKAGYREVAPFNDEPYAHHWFEKALT